MLANRADDKFIDVIYEKLLTNSGTQTITKDFKNLQTPTKSSDHYIIQTAPAIGVKDTAKMVADCSTEKYHAPEGAKQWKIDELDRNLSGHCK